MGASPRLAASVPQGTKTMRVLALIAIGVLCAEAQAPRATKIDPPSWWLGSTWSPVRVLIRGENLRGVRIDAPGSAARVSRVTVNERGTYAFADLDLRPVRKAGAIELRLTGAGGAAKASFEVLPALDRGRGFAGFSSDDVMYLIMPDRFANGDPTNDQPIHDRAKRRHYHGGDFQGIIDRLPYLKGLGVTALWLNPWYDNNDGLNQIERYDNEDITDYHGYGAVDFYDVEEHFGTFAKLRELVDKAHALGLKVIQDQVANHTGPYHPWTKDAPAPGWFNGTPAAHRNNDWQYWTQMDPNSTAAARRNALEGWFVNILPDLNQNDPECRRYLIQNALWWVGVLGLDGIRQDTMPYAAREFWAEWRGALAREFPKLNTVGEVLDGDAATVAFFQGGVKRFDGIDSRMESVFDFPLMYQLRKTFAEGQPLRDLARLLGKDSLYPDPARLVTLVGLHDVKRFLNEPGATPEGLKLAFTFLFTARGIPLVYYGDEVALAGGEDPDNRRDFPGGWKEDPRSAFEPAGRTAVENGVFEHVRQLIALRRDSEALRRGRTELLYTGPETAVYARRASDVVIAVFHNGKEAATVEFDAEGVYEQKMGPAAPLVVANGRARVTLPARSAAVYTRKPR